MKFDSYIERIIQYYTSPLYREDVNEAKGQFQETAGTFDEGAGDFENKIAQFTDWYVFTRKLKRVGQAPVEFCLEDSKFPMTEAERAIYFSLRNARHGLFEFLRVKGADVYIRDLFTDFVYIIRNSHVTVGFHRDEYFEARLIPYENEFVFSSAFCLHPHEVCGFISKEIRKIRKKPETEHSRSREELISRLFKMKQKHEQYRHLGIRDVYSNESKLRI